MTYAHTKSLVSLVLLFLLFGHNTVAQTQANDPAGCNEEHFLPKPNPACGPMGDIKCYGLPYGAIGIISHVLTYWAMLCIALGRRPSNPWRLITGWKWNFLLAVGAMVGCFVISTIQMAQCSHSCNFVLIALWTLCTSICVCVITIHRSCIRRREKRDERSGHHHRSRHHHRSERHSSKKDHGVNPAAFIWFFLHLAGTIIGMVGLLDLIKNSYWYDPVVRRLSLGFGITTIITAVLTGLYMYKRHRQRLHDGYDDFCSPWVCGVLATILAFLAGFCISSTLYCDVVLGMIAGNMLGRPSSDLWKLYWPWFIANRILLLIN